ncbi:hypothetical protein ACRAWF_30615 [Streptomyces sp. L7]
MAVRAYAGRHRIVTAGAQGGGPRPGFVPVPRLCAGGTVSDSVARARTLNQYLDPYPYFGRLREAGRVVRIRTAFAGEGWLVTRHEDAQSLAKDPRLSVDVRRAGPELRCRMDEFGFRFGDCLPETMLIMDPPAHTRLRRTVAGEFTPRRVAGLASCIEDTVDKLLDALPPDEPADLVTALAEPLPTMVICRLLGLGEQDATYLRPLVSALTELPVDPEAAARVARAREAVWTYLSHMVEEKRRTPDDGLLGALVSAHDDEGRLTDTCRTHLDGRGVVRRRCRDHHADDRLRSAAAHADNPEQWARLVDSPELVPRRSTNCCGSRVP